MTTAQRVTAQLTSFVTDLVKEVSINSVANLIETTPVDTGWARANWLPSIGSPVESPAGTRETVTTSNQDGGLAEIASSYTLDRGNIFISNNVPYILSLNMGTSTQAPPGFVQISIARAIASAVRRRV